MKLNVPALLDEIDGPVLLVGGTTTESATGEVVEAAFSALGPDSDSALVAVPRRGALVGLGRGRGVSFELVGDDGGSVTTGTLTVPSPRAGIVARRFVEGAPGWDRELKWVELGQDSVWSEGLESMRKFRLVVSLVLLVVAVVLFVLSM